jgi:hypothetical protein
MFRQARTLKFIAAAIAILVATLVVVWAVYFLMIQKKISKRPAALATPAMLYSRCSFIAAGEKSSA